MELNKENLPRFRVKTGVGVCQGAEFRTEDHPLPAWCYWTYKDEAGRYTGIYIQLKAPPGWKITHFQRAFRIDWYDSLDAAIAAVASIVFQAGYFMYSERFAERYREQMQRTGHQLPWDMPSEAELDALLAELHLPEGVYSRKVTRPLVNGGAKVTYRIVATWREGPVRQRRQRERVFGITAKRSLEQAIEQATQYRQAMLEKHGVYDSPFSEEPVYPGQLETETAPCEPWQRLSEAEIETQLAGLPLPVGVVVKKDRRPSSNGDERVLIRIAATWREGPLGQRRTRARVFCVNEKRSLEQAIEEAIQHRQAMLAIHDLCANAQAGTRAAAVTSGREE